MRGGKVNKATVKRVLKGYEAALENREGATANLRFAKEEVERLPDRIAKAKAFGKELAVQLAEAEARLTKPLESYAKKGRWYDSHAEYQNRKAQEVARLRNSVAFNQSALERSIAALANIEITIQEAKDKLGVAQVMVENAAVLLAITAECDDLESALKVAHALRASPKKKKTEGPQNRKLEGAGNSSRWVTTGIQIKTAVSRLPRKDYISFCGVITRVGGLRDYGQVVGRDSVVLEPQDGKVVFTYIGAIAGKSTFTNQAPRWGKEVHNLGFAE